MKPVYERSVLILTEFDNEDIIATSGIVPVVPDPTEPPTTASEKDNVHSSFSTFAKGGPGSWF